eukprot:1187816-Amphidinium_carterae.1
MPLLLGSMHTHSGKTTRPVAITHGLAIQASLFAPDCLTFATGGIDCAARLWDTLTGELLRSFLWHSDWVFSAIFSPDGELALLNGAPWHLLKD